MREKGKSGQGKSGQGKSGQGKSGQGKSGQISLFFIFSSVSAKLALISQADWPRGGRMARPLRLNLPGGF
jgi:hypothetical protein